MTFLQAPDLDEGSRPLGAAASSTCCFVETFSIPLQSSCCSCFLLHASHSIVSPSACQNHCRPTRLIRLTNLHLSGPSALIWAFGLFFLFWVYSNCLFADVTILLLGQETKTELKAALIRSRVVFPVKYQQHNNLQTSCVTTVIHEWHYSHWHVEPVRSDRFRSVGFLTASCWRLLEYVHIMICIWIMHFYFLLFARVYSEVRIKRWFT